MPQIEKRIVSGGTVYRHTHQSTSTKTEMTLSVFIPGEDDEDQSTRASFPVIYYLSGLTCTDQNFATKASSAYKAAGSSRVALVIPDTSPRNAGVAGEKDVFSLGEGAGFYVNATKDPWATNYNMYDYITEELPVWLKSTFGLQSDAVSIMGHSMGGMGALQIALKNTDRYVSVSALAPMTAPTQIDWGKAAFSAYLADESEHAQYDPCELMAATTGPSFDDILIDQGDADEFLERLQPQSFTAACAAKGQKCTLNMRPGFDHSYYFVNSFIASHIAFHSRRLHPRKQKTLAAGAVTKAASVVAGARPGLPIECQAMVAFAPKQPLELCDIVVAAPKAGEVRVKVIANALCHTDVYTQSGQDPEGLFPSILGHEAGCVVESVGEGVTSVKPGDHVVPAYTPQCCLPSCIFCQSPKTNLCPSIRGTQGRGVMPDGTSRFTLKKDGSTIWHFMGTSTFAEYTVLSEWSCAKVDMAAPLNEVCLLGCGVSTGLGAVWNNCKVEAGSSVAVFGLGAVGLSVVQGAQMAGASSIFVIDINPSKFEYARELGATHFVNPLDHPGVAIQSVLTGMSPTGYGFDYTFDCTGNVQVMRSALECAHRGWGVSCVIGVAPSGAEIATRPFQVVTGRRWIGTAFGGWKSRSDIPKLVKRTLDGSLKIDHFITHKLQGVAATNQAIDILHQGACLRCVVEY